MSSDTKVFTFDSEILERCDAVAFECLGVVEQKKRFPDLQSVLYENKTFGDFLLVCADGSVLFAPSEIGVNLLLDGFKNGLRSNKAAVQESSSQN